MNILKKIFDKHFNFDDEFINAVAEKHNFDEKQTERFREFCSDFQKATHIDYRYQHTSHKEQQNILTDVIEGIKKTPEKIENFKMYKERNCYFTPSYKGVKLDEREYPGVYHEIEVTAAAIWPEDANGEQLNK